MDNTPRNDCAGALTANVWETPRKQPYSRSGSATSLLAQANCGGLEVYGALATLLVPRTPREENLGQPSCTAPYYFVR